MRYDIGRVIFALYAKEERLTFNKVKRIITYIHLKYTRGTIDIKLAHTMLLKVLSSLVPCCTIKNDLKSFDTSRTLNMIFKNKKITYQEAFNLMVNIELEHKKRIINSSVAYKLMIKTLSSLNDNFIDEVVIYE